MKIIILDTGRSGDLNVSQPTHPVIATLDIPLFAFGVKREFENDKKIKLSPPSLRCSRREGRPAKRGRGESTPLDRAARYVFPIGT